MQNNQMNPAGGSSFYSRMSTLSGVGLLSDSMYNLLIGLMLLWGFLVNYLMTKFAGASIVRYLYMNEESSGTILIVFLLAYFGLCIGGSRLMRSPNVALDFLGYNMIVIPIGVLLCVALQSYRTDVIVEAIVITAAITLLMIVASTIYPAIFASMGRGLSAALLATILVDLVATLIFHKDFTIIDYIVTGIMSLYIGFDWVRAWSCQRTPNNAIAVAASLYLDIVNILLRVLRILNRSKSRN